MTLSVLGINFRSAPVAVRETVALQQDQVAAALTRIQERLPEAEALVLSTCNRTELYLVGPEVEESREALIEALLPVPPAGGINGLAKHFYLKGGADAIEHLLCVACSLDSMVVGETEILGQLKQAYAMASRAGSLGGSLHPMFHAAFRTAKRVFSETEICQGRVSVSSLAVEFTLKVFDDLSDKSVMIVGAGETAELALKSLVDKGVQDVTVLNRSLSKGQALANRYGGRALPFEQLAQRLQEADIVVSSTATSHCVIETETVRQAVRRRRGQPLLLIDIAVPRDIEDEVGRLDNVYLYQIDDLQRLADENLERRRDAVTAAQAIVTEEVGEMTSTLHTDGFGAVMRDLDERTLESAEAILKRTLAKEKMADLPEDVRQEIETMARKIAMSILARPRTALKEAVRNGRWDHYVQVTKDLFGLHSSKKDK